MEKNDVPNGFIEIDINDDTPTTKEEGQKKKVKLVNNSIKKDYRATIDNLKEVCSCLRVMVYMMDFLLALIFLLCSIIIFGIFGKEHPECSEILFYMVIAFACNYLIFIPIIFCLIKYCKESIALLIRLLIGILYTIILVVFSQGDCVMNNYVFWYFLGCIGFHYYLIPILLLLSCCKNSNLYDQKIDY